MRCDSCRFSFVDIGEGVTVINISIHIERSGRETVGFYTDVCLYSPNSSREIYIKNVRMFYCFFGKFYSQISFFVQLVAFVLFFYYDG